MRSRYSTSNSLSLTKIRRVVKSTATAETISAYDAVNTALYLHALLSKIHIEHCFELSMDSLSVPNNAKCIKEPEEKLKKVDLASLRETFEEGFVRAHHWIPSRYLIADALTKRNTTTSAHLLQVLSKGY